MQRYRMYVDEVGNPSMKKPEGREQYLSLSGIVISDDAVKNQLTPEFDRLKRTFFQTDPDEHVIFHRKEIALKKPPFNVLSDPASEKAFNDDFLAVIERLPFSLITVVIDKAEHLRRYVAWREDPYYYCTLVLLERYLQLLEHENAVGDLLAEARGAAEDLRLKNAFRTICEKGDGYAPANLCSRRLTTKELKVKRKQDNVAGLQLADLVAFPSYLSMRTARCGEEMKENFNRLVIPIIEKKYRRNWYGRVEGVGKKWLP
jgi:hypothetical protein